MAVARPAAPAAADQVTEREYAATLNRAVEDTEQEIFTDALGEDELENDGDTTLEDMGEGLEGEVEETDADEDGEDADEEEGEAEGNEEAEAEGEETAEGEEAEGDEPRDERGPPQRQDDRRIPPGRLREEATARRAAEERANTLERQLAEMNGRVAELSARVNAPQPKPAAQTEQPKPKPDMFADPEGYQQWVLEEAERRAEAKLELRFQSYEQRQQAQSAQRVDMALAEAARGPRSFEFTAAYGALPRSIRVIPPPAPPSAASTTRPIRKRRCGTGGNRTAPPSIANGFSTN